MQHWRLLLLQASTSDAIPEEAKAIAKEKSRKPFEHFIPLLMEGQRLGEIVPGDPLVLAITYFSIIQGLAITKIQHGGDIPFPSVDIILRFLK
ncbi:hypothetical protein D3C73_675550 [compost metagenome]